MPDQSFRLATPRYTLTVDPAAGELTLALGDGSAPLLNSGWPLLLVPEIVGASLVPGSLTMRSSTTLEGHPRLLLTARLAGSVNAEVTNEIISLPDRLVCASSYVADADHALAHWHLAPAGSTLGGDAVFVYNGDAGQRENGQTFPLSGPVDLSTASRNWLYNPMAPRVLLKSGHYTLALGGTSLAQDFGLELRTARPRVEHFRFNYGGAEEPLAIPAHTAQRGPRLQVQVTLSLTDDQAQAAFTQAMVEDGIVTPRRYRPEESAWRRPWYCTWGDQVAMAAGEHAADMSANTDYALVKAMLTPEMILRAARLIRERGLNIGTLIIDDGWQDFRGDWNLLTGKFPDMRGLVDELHALDFRVMMWWAPFALEAEAEVNRHPELVAGPMPHHGQTVLNYTSPAARAWAREKLELWFSDAPGGWDLDGLKLDFLAEQVYPVAGGDPEWRGGGAADAPPVGAGVRRDAQVPRRARNLDRPAQPAPHALLDRPGLRGALRPRHVLPHPPPGHGAGPLPGLVVLAAFQLPSRDDRGLLQPVLGPRGDPADRQAVGAGRDGGACREDQGAVGEVGVRREGEGRDAGGYPVDRSEMMRVIPIVLLCILGVGWLQVPGAWCAGAPVARAGPDVAVNSDRHHLDASHSEGLADCDVLWTQTQGPAGATISHPTAGITPVVDLGQGAYTFRLTLTDRGGATSTDEVVIAVPAEQAPDKVDDFVTKAMAKAGVRGLSLAIIDGGKVVKVKGYGYTDADRKTPVTPLTLFQAASTSKVLTAVAALRLVGENRLALDEDVNAKLASWKVPENQFTKDEKVTLRRLMAHTGGINMSGFYGYPRGEPIPSLAEVLEGKPPANSAPLRVGYVPGTKTEYSGGGYVIIQQLVVDVCGETFEKYMQDNVFGKLGMASSTFECPLPQAKWDLAAHGYGYAMPDGKSFPRDEMPWKWNNYPESAAAGLWTTAGDLALFVIDIQGTYAGRSSKVITKDMAATMLTPDPENKWHLGLGPVLEHPGKANAVFRFSGTNGGFQCGSFGTFQTGQGCVIMYNDRAGEQFPEDIRQFIAGQYAWPK